MPGHKCKNKYFLLVHQEDDFDYTNSHSQNQLLDSDPTILIPLVENPQTHLEQSPTPHISLNTLVGHAATETLHVTGTIKTSISSF